MYRVMVVDDQEAFRRLACVMLRKNCEFQVVCEAGDGEEAVRMADENEVDLIIMDVEMPGMGGLAATEAIIKQRPHIKVVLVSMFGDAEYTRAGLEAGAVAFTPKTELSGDSLRAAVNSTTPVQA